MINKVAASATPSPQDQQQVASSNDISWEQYAKAIDDLKTNPPKMYAVTIPMFTQGHMSFPTWQIPDFVSKAGMDPSTIPPVHGRRIIVTDKFLEILQKEVPGYLLDVVEVDPITGQPLQVAKLEGKLSPSQGQTPASAALPSPHIAATTKTAREPNSTASPSSKVARPPKQKEQYSLPEAQPFDFTQLTPELQQTTIRLAEQLLTAALRQLSGSDQLGGDLSSLLDRTA
jgi:cell division septation protein DedD